MKKIKAMKRKRQEIEETSEMEENSEQTMNRHISQMDYFAHRFHYRNSQNFSKKISLKTKFSESML